MAALRGLFFALFALFAHADNPEIINLFSDVTTSSAHVYGLSDSDGQSMACIHAYEAQTPAVWGGSRYYGVYMSHVGDAFEVRLAHSNDLISWTFVRTLLPNADMPFISFPSPANLRASEQQAASGVGGWILLAHEQWMRPKSQAPSQLGFKLYYNESELSAGSYFNSYVAPLSVGKKTQIEGTPSIYSSQVVSRDGEFVVDADIGFHFNSKSGIDQVASGKLTSFGPTNQKPKFTAQQKEDDYDQLFISKGAIGNIGQRKAGTVKGTHICAQEANIGKMPPTVWADWRIWIYFFASGEGDIPTGQSGDVTQLAVKTHAGSTAFGNPSWQVLSCPTGYGNSASASGDCLFVSYFAFSEGAKPGEAGVLAFWKPLGGPSPPGPSPPGPSPPGPSPTPPPPGPLPTPPPPGPTPGPSPGCFSPDSTNRKTCCGACAENCPGHCGHGDCACSAGAFYDVPDPGCTTKAKSKDGKTCCGKCAEECPGHCGPEDCSCKNGDFYAA